MTTSSAVDPERPEDGRGWYYLVAGSNPAGEGPLGMDSLGRPRERLEPCP
ncbi:MAG: hypothetical protein AAF533_13445 [Acidobacteriota bacterium]